MLLKNRPNAIEYCTNNRRKVANAGVLGDLSCKKITQKIDPM
jgi:hypothetical protein